MKKTYSVLLSSLLISTSAVAATGTVQFGGVVQSSCSFTSSTSGVLWVNPSTPNVLSTINNGNGGSGAQIGINYIGNPTLTVSPVMGLSQTPAGFNESPMFSTEASSTATGHIPLTTNGSSKTYTTGNQDVITVDLTASLPSDHSFPVGTYSASTSVTCQ